MDTRDKTRLDKATDKLDNLLFDREKKFDVDVTVDKEYLDKKLQAVKKEIMGDQNGDILTLTRELTNRSENRKKPEKNVINVNKIIEDESNMNVINNLIYSEQERIMNYQKYKTLYDAIPEISEAISIMTDNIISPDDFTKNSLSYFYEDEDNAATIINNLKDLTDLYDIEDLAPEIIKNALTYGDEFIAVINLAERLTSLVKETAIQDQFNTILNEADLLWDNKEVKEFSKIVKLDETKVKTDFTNFLNNFIEFRDQSCLLEDNKEIIDDVNKILKADYRDKFIKGADQRYKDGLTAIRSKKKDSDVNLFESISGSYIKVLDRERTIKLYYDGKCFGYYYIDLRENIETGNLTSAMSGKKTSMNMFYDPVIMSQDGYMRSKQDFIYNNITRNLAKRIDKKFIADNPQFKDIIYNILRQEDIYRYKIRVIFFPEDSVFHFMPNSNRNEYGDSIIKKVLFIASVYYSVLTASLMFKITRSYDKRIWYIETSGIDKKQEEAVMSFMQDIRAKDIRIQNPDDVTQVIRHVGLFQDIVIPTFGGEKPVEVENFDGQNIDLNNDFLDYLKRGLITGLTVPGPQLGYTDDVEFAKTLTMVNGKFLRNTIIKQKNLSRPFTSLYRKLYENEFIIPVQFKKEKDPKNKAYELEIDLSKIFIKFPSPSALNFTNMLEQIASARDIVEFFSDTLVMDKDDELLMRITKKNIFKTFLPTLDWENLEKIVIESENETKKLATLMSKTGRTLDNNQDNSMSGGGDYGSGEDDYGMGGDDDYGMGGGGDDYGMGGDDNEDFTATASDGKNYSDDSTGITNPQDLDAAKSQLGTNTFERQQMNEIEDLEKQL